VRIIITILFLFISANIFSQYVAHWTPTGQRLDSVQQSIDSINFKTIAIVKGGVDTCKVPGPTYYYRLKSGSVISNKVLVYEAMPVNIINVYTQNGFLNWTSGNENNLDYYSIEESVDGVHFIETERVIPKGNSTYKINLK